MLQKLVVLWQILSGKPIVIFWQITGSSGVDKISQ